MNYLGDWKVIQGEISEERILNLPDCLEKIHLQKIREFLIKEEFNPDTFYVHEYPIEGVYICCQDKQENYFCIQDDRGVLRPYYTTIEYDDNGHNNFPCDSIRESINRMECQLDQGDFKN